jgi:hypothetical protein
VIAVTGIRVEVITVAIGGDILAFIDSLGTQRYLRSEKSRAAKSGRDNDGHAEQ